MPNSALYSHSSIEPPWLYRESIVKLLNYRFPVSSVSLEAVNKRERDKLYKVILRAKITAKRVFH